MSDLISREWVLNKIWEREKEPNYQHESEDWCVGLIMAENIVNSAPTIKAEPIKHEKLKIVNIRAYHGTLYSPRKNRKNDITKRP